MENSKDIQEAVKARYRQAAAGGGCCNSSSEIVEFQQIRGYSSDQVQSIPKGADLGLGCGNPTALAPIEPGMTVLDLGSGAGIDVFLAARKVGPNGRVIGVDMTEEMIDKARKNAAREGISNVEFRLGQIEALPVEDGSVDLILSNCVINLSPDKDQVFREIYRVLRPGGRFQISDIVTRGPASDAMRRDAELWAGCISGALEKEVYLDKLRQAGFSEIEVVKEVEYDAHKTDAFALVSISLVATR
ncbi:MAG: arsenite methyltransferase [Acidobacteriota bacterium]